MFLKAELNVIMLVMLSFMLLSLLSCPWLSSSLVEDNSHAGLAAYLQLSIWLVLLKRSLKHKLNTKNIIAYVFFLILSLWLLLAGLRGPAACSATIGFLFICGYKNRNWLALIVTSVLTMPLNGFGWNELCREMSLYFLTPFIAMMSGVELVGKSLIINGEYLMVLESCSGATIIRLSLLFLCVSYWITIKNNLKSLVIVIPFICCLNSIRLLLCILIVKFSSVTHIEHLDNIIGLMVFGCGLFFIFKDIELSKLNWNKTFFYWLSPYFLLVIGEFRETIHLNQHISHESNLISVPYSGTIEFHEFSEKGGLGKWYLLEHPLENCLKIKGYNLDLERFRSNEKSKIKKFQVEYKLGDLKNLSRSEVYWHLIKSPKFWKSSLKANVWLIDQTI